MDNPHPISIGALVSGLMSDFRCLLRQEMELARHEMEHERHKLSSIMIQSGIGLLLGMICTMSGLVFKQDVGAEGLSFGSSQDAILANFDNKGTPFPKFAREVFERSFDGAGAILVDAPNPVTDITSLDDVRRLGIRPYAVIYPQAAVTNWRYEVNPVSKAQELTLAVLHEVSDEPAGEFSWTVVERYRVFRKTPQGIVWQIWRAVETAKHNKEREFILESEGIYDSRVRQIPLVVMGKLTNQPPRLNIFPLLFTVFICKPLSMMIRSSTRSASMSAMPPGITLRVGMFFLNDRVLSTKLGCATA